ncbi:MAG: tetratricopeptide repeat protein [Steroidobacteraceae bacterium]
MIALPVRLPRVLGIGLLMSLAACSSINPYQSAPVVVPPSGSAVLAPEETVLETQAVEPIAPVEPSIPLPPTRSYKLNAASRALVNQADAQRKSGNFVQAAATLERALRIEPKNPLLWLEYGALRMDESNFAQAENMGRKALSNASGDLRAQAAAWRLIADSYRARDNNTEAQRATATANELIGR